MLQPTEPPTQPGLPCTLYLRNLGQDVYQGRSKYQETEELIEEKDKGIPCYGKEMTQDKNCGADLGSN